MFRCHKTNTAFHNLFPSNIKLPTGTKSLLGLGLKFCTEQGRPYQDLCTPLKQFKHSTDNHEWRVKEGVEPNKDSNRRLWVPLEKVPTPSNNELAAAFDCFEVLVNKLRNDLPTY
mmetsp:Transcript_20284/g.21729  ORF Transcript_20284/g.21729 Transcript_20284/m.21729 type:complete len:115 (+) Transcript_20284:495-839(+)